MAPFSRTDTEPASRLSEMIARGKSAARQAGLAAAYARSWIRAPNGPIRVVMSVTRRCNLRCSMCRSWQAQVEGELSPAEIGSILSEMPELLSLDLTGGEPFVRPDMDEVLDTVLRTAPRLRMLHFTTNGWLGERAATLVKAVRRQRPDLEIVPTVSVDGPPEVHDEVRGREGSFERAISAFEQLSEIPGVRPYVGTTVTPLNASRVEELGEILGRRLNAFDPSFWHWNWLQISSHFFGNEDLRLPEDEIPERLLPRHIARRGLPSSLMDLMEACFILNLEFVRRGEPADLPCQAMRSTAFISAEGVLYPCHVWDRPVGDARRGFASLWRSEEAMRARRGVERLACGGCFTPCEAYPMFAGAPLTTLRVSTSRALRLAGEMLTASRKGRKG
ncbi:MAG: radical SAM/SPASM domain-containing protein [Myxococcota bacterium]